MLRPRAATGALTDEGEVTAARWNGRIHASRGPRRRPPSWSPALDDDRASRRREAPRADAPAVRGGAVGDGAPRSAPRSAPAFPGAPSGGAARGGPAVEQDPSFPAAHPPAGSRASRGDGIGAGRPRGGHGLADVRRQPCWFEMPRFGEPPRRLPLYVEHGAPSPSAPASAPSSDDPSASPSSARSSSARPSPSTPSRSAISSSTGVGSGSRGSGSGARARPSAPPSRSVPVLEHRRRRAARHLGGLEPPGRPRRGPTGRRPRAVRLRHGLRNPALLAKAAATIDEISEGRLVLDLGCGSHPHTGTSPAGSTPPATASSGRAAPGSPAPRSGSRATRRG